VRERRCEGRASGVSLAGLGSGERMFFRVLSAAAPLPSTFGYPLVANSTTTSLLHRPDPSSCRRRRHRPLMRVQCCFALRCRTAAADCSVGQRTRAMGRALERQPRPIGHGTNARPLPPAAVARWCCAILLERADGKHTFGQCTLEQSRLSMGKSAVERHLPYRRNCAACEGACEGAAAVAAACGG
jgi:hypothetical protein